MSNCTSMKYELGADILVVDGTGFELEHCIWCGLASFDLDDDRCVVSVNPCRLHQIASAFPVPLCAVPLDHAWITHDPVRYVGLCPSDPQSLIITQPMRADHIDAPELHAHLLWRLKPMVVDHKKGGVSLSVSVPVPFPVLPDAALRHVSEQCF